MPRGIYNRKPRAIKPTANECLNEDQCRNDMIESLIMLEVIAEIGPDFEPVALARLAKFHAKHLLDQCVLYLHSIK